MNRFGLNANQLTLITQLFKKYPMVKKVLVYGSRAKGTFHDRSDVDLVITDSQLDRQTLGNIILDINNSDFPYTVDLQDWINIQNPKLKEHIQRVGQVFYSI